MDVIGELNREEPNYSAISGILITSDDATPDQLAEALYYVNDVATEDGADAILDYLDREPTLFPINQDSTPGGFGSSTLDGSSRCFEANQRESALGQQTLIRLLSNQPLRDPRFSGSLRGNHHEIGIRA